MKREERPERDPEEETVDRFLSGQPRASELEVSCSALLVRIRAMKQMLKGMAPSAESEILDGRIRDAKRQLAILRQEQAISRFVEESVRVTLNRDAVEPDEEDEWAVE